MAGRRRPNHRLIKLHRNYTIGEVARVLTVHKNTVRNWIDDGLPTIPGPRPTLILGLELRQFLAARRAAAKQPCPPAHIYCVRCRSPKRPAGNMVDYLPMTPTGGNLRGICPDCEGFIYRRIAHARLVGIQGELDVAFPQAPIRLRESDVPSVDCDSGRAHKHEAEAQRG